ncbi:DUF2982 domain-containing protein [Bowmanella dokdonensis]|uniref:DUF2982 domain-containing protein n=1 Tax=Bowmanella dokdonensis TaxID=751969 RepID=A0A939IPS6_9ALTE|nr:DUF2982 domain-containing protein [Bowmanella dokdonensis]MBN7823862.1 DUF2982 domain-containing protein [Bowmanella dokdonensis]
MAQDLIQIRAGAKRNGFSLCFFGIIGLLLSSAWLAWMPEWLRLAGIFLVSASLVTILIGWFKVREPVFSLELTRRQLLYRHRYGSWQLGWDNIQRIDIPRVQSGLDHIEMELVGIRIKDYGPLLDSISVRLASNILMQQRPLLLQASRDNCQTGQCYSESLIEEDRFRLGDRIYTGIRAMLANRMQKMRATLGYDLYIYASELDRPESEFINLLRACQQQAVQQRTADGHGVDRQTLDE